MTETEGQNGRQRLQLKFGAPIYAQSAVMGQAQIRTKVSGQDA